MRRNLGTILIGLGAFLVAFAPLLKFFIAPSVVAVPKDFWAISTLRDDGASYFDTRMDKTVSGAHVVMINTVRGDVRAAKKDSLAVWDSFTVIKQDGAQQDIAVNSNRFALDRRTGGLANCCGAAIDGNPLVKQSGLGVIFPVAAVQRKTYLYFDPTTQQAWPIAYRGTEKVGGLDTYRFVQSVPETRVAAIDPIPAKSLGLDEKKYKQPLPVDKYYSITRTLWVDPRTGVPVSERDQMHAVAKTRDLAGQVVLADADLRTTADSQKQLVKLSDGYAAKFDAVRGWGPAVLLIVGLLALVAGAVVHYLLPTKHRTPKVEPVPTKSPPDDPKTAGMLPGFRPGSPASN